MRVARSRPSSLFERFRAFVRATDRREGTPFACRARINAHPLRPTCTQPSWYSSSRSLSSRHAIPAALPGNGRARHAISRRRWPPDANRSRGRCGTIAFARPAKGELRRRREQGHSPCSGRERLRRNESPITARFSRSRRCGNSVKTPSTSGIGKRSTKWDACCAAVRSTSVSASTASNMRCGTATSIPDNAPSSRNVCRQLIRLRRCGGVRPERAAPPETRRRPGLEAAGHRSPPDVPPYRRSRRHR